MKRTALLITLTLILVSVGLYWAYHEFYKGKGMSYWDIVPNHAVFIYEKGECSDCWEKLKNSPISIIFKGPRDSTFSKKLTDFLFSSESKLISLHVRSKDDFDLIFYQTENVARKNFFETMFVDKSIKHSSRELDGVIIEEYLRGDQIFSSVQLEGLWVGSFTPFLVEDVIRLYRNRDSNSFFESELRSSRDLPQVKNDAGNFYVNYEALLNFLKIFDGSVQQNIFATAAKLDIKNQENDLIELNGFTTLNDTLSVLSVLSQQTPVSFDLKRLISNETVFVTSLGISSGKDYYRRQKSKTQKLSDSVDIILKPYHSKIEQLVGSIQDEVAICLNQDNRGALSKIILVETDNIKLWSDVLGELAADTETGDTIFSESFAQTQIGRIDVENFPVRLFNPFVTSFKTTYYTTLGNVVLFGEDLVVLKKFMEDIEQENTWGQTIASNRFFESTLLESNLSFYFETERILNAIGSSLNPKWDKLLKLHKKELKRLGKGAIQFSNLNENFYTSIFLSYKAGDSKQTIVKERETFIEADILTGPMIVKNHNDKSYETLIQDSLYNLCLIAADGKLLWKQNIGSKIVSHVSQVDYFKNGKLQYFFATKDAIFVIDRLGNPVAPFPVQLMQKKINCASVVDYDRSKNYRFLITERSSRVFLTDKSGSMLDGWNPLEPELNEELSFYPDHFRLAGKDYFILVTRNGNVHLANRRGEMLPKFPVNTDLRLVGNYFIEPGKTTASSKVILVSKDGFRIQVNLEGKILSKETLVKPSIDASFALVKEKNEKSYLILRQDSKRLTLLDVEGKEILSNEFVADNRAFIEFIDHGLDGSFIIVLDKDQELLYLYDGKGVPLIPSPVDAKGATVVPAKSGYELITTHQRSVKRQPIQ